MHHLSFTAKTWQDLCTKEVQATSAIHDGDVPHLQSCERYQIRLTLNTGFDKALQLKREPMAMSNYANGNIEGFRRRYTSVGKYCLLPAGDVKASTALSQPAI